MPALGSLIKSYGDTGERSSDCLGPFSHFLHEILRTGWNMRSMRGERTIGIAVRDLAGYSIRIRLPLFSGTMDSSLENPWLAKIVRSMHSKDKEQYSDHDL